MDDSKKTIDVVIQATKLTVDIFRNVIYDLTTKRNYESRGNVSLGQLMKQGKLDSIEITDNNIKSFLDVAKKYDVSYALKRDSSTSPPTYHVFFTGRDTETLNKAFKEYVGVIDKKLNKGQKEKSVGKVVNREQIKKNARTIKKMEKEKQRNKGDIER
jgi:hypothetical protein|nr:PcfB family protein [Ruminococcus sp. 1001270H_150608_F2]